MARNIKYRKNLLQISKKHYICPQFVSFYNVDRKPLRYICLLFTLFLLLPFSLRAAGETFVVVIDAGHGGKDPGAKGAIVNEKEINLAVALKLGRLIEENHRDVRVVYTRKTDRFIELDERAEIANRHKADLFISIHTNAVKRGSSARGTETYTLGLARSEENLEVAMRENAAILLEDNYQQKYEGFDPNSSESYIIFEFIQNKHVEQSISLASEVQKCFASANRANRGVRQAGFLVLRKTSMPSILVELGYISNREEERFMKSDSGRGKLAKALYDAFTKYKRDYDRRRGALAAGSSASPANPPKRADQAPTGKRGDSRNADQGASASDSRQTAAPAGPKASSAAPAAKTTPAVNPDTRGKVIYKIQILTSDKKLPPGSRQFKGYKNVGVYREKGLYKYTYGESTHFNTIRNLRRKVARDFKDAFIVAFKDGKKVNY